MPPIAALLSLLGAAPFVLFGLGADYAALILGFAGGVHWGLALLPDAAKPTLRFSAATLPLIVAWLALALAQMVDPTVALVVLILGYLATVLTEHRAARRFLVPVRYVWMRWAFTAVGVAMMTIVLILRGVGQTIVF
jgi:hypothetical protein